MGPIRVKLSRHFDRNVQMVTEAKNLSAKTETQTDLEDDSLDFGLKRTSNFDIISNGTLEEEPAEQKNQIVPFDFGDFKGIGFSKSVILRADQKLLTWKYEMPPEVCLEKDKATTNILKLEVESTKAILFAILNENLPVIFNETFKHCDIKFKDFNLSNLLRSPTVTTNHEKRWSPKCQKIHEIYSGKTSEDVERKPVNRIGDKIKNASSKSFWWTNKSNLLEPKKEPPGATNCVVRKFEQVGQECSTFLLPKIEFGRNQNDTIKLEISGSDWTRLSFPKASEPTDPSSVDNSNPDLNNESKWTPHSSSDFSDLGCSLSVGKMMDQVMMIDQKEMFGIPSEQEKLCQNFKTQAECSSPGVTTTVSTKLSSSKNEKYLISKEQTEASNQNKETENLDLQKTKWTAPLSPHALIEETFHDNPWSLLVATIFLNKTSCSLAKPHLDTFLEDHPTPEKVLSKNPEHLEPYFVNLGLARRRSVQIWRMSRDFVHKPWKRVSELYGIGKYGEDAFRMFCLGDFSVEPSDRFLKIYKAWYLMTEKEERKRSSDV